MKPERNVRAIEIWHMITGSRALFLMLPSLSAAMSIIILLSVPSGYFSGDVMTYVTLGKEVVGNGLAIPATNTIHYPGSIWVYPPVIPEISAFLILLSPSGAIYMITAFSILVVALASIPVYLLSRNLFGKDSGAIAGLAYAFYFPSLYGETWGGIPQLFSFLLILSLLALMTSPENTHPWRRIAFISAISFAIPFVHDLTSIVLLLSLMLSLIASLVLKERKSRVPLFTAFSILSMAAGVAMWYVPRLWWVIDSAFPGHNPVYQSLIRTLPRASGSGSILLSLYSLQQPSGILSDLQFGWIPIILAFSIAVTAALALLKRDHRALFAGLVLVPLSLMLYNVSDPVLFSRFSYFVYLYSFILFSPILLEAARYIVKGLSRPWESAKIAIPLLLSAALISGAFGGMAFESSSHSYYGLIGGNETNNTDAYQVSNFLAGVYTNGTVAATGQIGFLLMGDYGIPVIEYQPLNFLTQPVEWQESAAAYTLVYDPAGNISFTQQLISEFSVTFVVIQSSSNVAVPGFYHLVFLTGYYELYRV